MIPEGPAGARQIIAPETVSAALDRQAQRLVQRLEAKQSEAPAGIPPLVLVVMNGGMFPAVELTRRMAIDLHFDYVHATRYQGRTRGQELKWIHRPVTDLRGRHVLLIDDIFDEGYTLEAIVAECHRQSCASVLTAVLAVKDHDRGLGRDRVDDGALQVPDEYVFGCGMDLHECWRHLPGIWVPASNLEEST